MTVWIHSNIIYGPSPICSIVDLSQVCSERMAISRDILLLFKVSNLIKSCDCCSYPSWCFYIPLVLQFTWTCLLLHMPYKSCSNIFYSLNGNWFVTYLWNNNSSIIWKSEDRLTEIIGKPDMSGSLPIFDVLLEYYIARNGQIFGFLW